MEILRLKVKLEQIRLEQKRWKKEQERVKQQSVPPSTTSQASAPAQRTSPLTKGVIEKSVIREEKYPNGQYKRQEIQLNATDILVKEWYENGQQKSEKTFRRGMFHGVFKIWNRQGVLLGAQRYQEGRLLLK